MSGGGLFQKVLGGPGSTALACRSRFIISSVRGLGRRSKEMRNVGLHNSRSDLGLFQIRTHSELNWFSGILATSHSTEESQIANLEVVWEQIECGLADFGGGKNLIFERFSSWPKRKRGVGVEATYDLPNGSREYVI